MKIKKITSLLFTIAILGVSYSQVAISKTSITNSSVSLEFNNTENKGIILPWVSSTSAVESNASSALVSGTFVLDVTDSKIKLYNEGTWEDLSILPGVVDTSLQSGLTDDGKGVIIGADSSAATGVLVLESPTKAMILPQIPSPHTVLNNPKAGTVVYDPTSESLCVYNGQYWAFWGE